MQKANQAANRKNLVIQLNAVCSQSKVAKNNIGIMSFSEFSLLNLEKKFRDQQLFLDKNKVRIELKCNTISMSSENATLVNHKEKEEQKDIAFYPANRSYDTYFSEGKSYKLSNCIQTSQNKSVVMAKNVDPYSSLQWKNNGQFNAFVNSAHNQVEINIIVDTIEVDTGRKKSFTVGRQKIPVSELAVFLDGSAKDHKFAIEMDYIPFHDDSVLLKEELKSKSEGERKFGYGSLMEKDNFKNILHPSHHDQLILLLNIDFQYEIIKGIRELKEMK
jgi:hypothetical protein